MFRKPTAGEIVGVLAYLAVMVLFVVGAVLTFPGR